MYPCYQAEVADDYNYQQQEEAYWEREEEERRLQQQRQQQGWAADDRSRSYTDRYHPYERW